MSQYLGLNKKFFQFMSELFTLFFERVHATQPIVPCFSSRPMIDAHMHMWGKLFPRKGQLEFPITSVNRDACYLLASEDNIFLNIVPYAYMVLDWRRCSNIRFTTIEPLDERGNIICMF
jgi:hypothetical protein